MGISRGLGRAAFSVSNGRNVSTRGAYRTAHRFVVADRPVPPAAHESTAGNRNGWHGPCSWSLARLTDTADLEDPTAATETKTMGNDYYNEKKFCDKCQTYVRFLMSVNRSFCAECGTPVRLFNKEDTKRFSETVQKHRWQAS